MLVSLPKNIRFKTPRTNPKTFDERYSDWLDKDDDDELPVIKRDRYNSRPFIREEDTAKKVFKELSDKGLPSDE